MSDKEAPDTPEGQPEAPKDWEIRDGRIFIDGEDVTTILRPGTEDDEDETATPEPPPEPALEGEGQEVTEPEKPKEKVEAEPEVEEETPDEEESVEAEEPKVPEKWKFKLKFRGKEDEVEWDKEQVQHRLTKLRAFEENEKEFWERRKEVEPYFNIVKSEWFKEKLKEGYESGELEKPPTPPEPPPAVQYEIAKRQAEPDYDEVLSALQTYALNLTPEAMRIIDSDPTVFLSEYDRIAKEVRATKDSTDKGKTTAAKKTPKLTPEEAKRKLALKESSKTRAQTTRPGQATEAVPQTKQWEKRKVELEKALRNPANAHRNLEITAELLMHLDSQPTQ